MYADVRQLSPEMYTLSGDHGDRDGQSKIFLVTMAYNHVRRYGQSKNIPGDNGKPSANTVATKVIFLFFFLIFYLH